MRNYFLFFLFFLFQINCSSQINWTLSNSGMPSGYSIIDFALAPNGDIYLLSSLYSTSASGFTPKLMKSTDNGVNWSEINMSTTNINSPGSLIFKGEKLLFGGAGSTDYYIYSSEDYGENWTLSNSGMPSGYSIIDFALAPNGDIYLLSSLYSTSASGFTPKLMKSTDNGVNWSEINMSTTNINSPGSLIFKGEKLLFGGTGSTDYYIYSSEDYGENWTLSNSGMPSGYSIIDFALAPNGDIYLLSSLYSTSASGFTPKLMKSTDNGVNWSEINMSTTNINSPGSLIFKGEKLLFGGTGSTGYYIYSSENTNSKTEQNNISRFTIGPNPFFNKLYFNNTENYNLLITKVDGSIVLNTQIQSNYILNTTDFESGLYLISLSNINSLTTYKLIKK